MQLYKEKVIQGTSALSLKQKCAWCVQGTARRQVLILRAKSATDLRL